MEVSTSLWGLRNRPWVCRTLFGEYNNTNKSGYSTYREWTETESPSRHFSTNQMEGETQDDRGKDGGIIFTLEVKKQTLHQIPQGAEAQDETRGYNKIYKITKTEMGSPCNENGEYKNYQKNNRMDAI